MGVVAVGQVALGDRPRAADAFGDVLAGHLEVDAAGIDALGLCDLDEALHLGQDAVERPGLVAVAGGERVAVHRVDGPDHLAALACDGAHQRRQALSILSAPKRPIERQPARLVVGVEQRRSGAAARRLGMVGPHFTPIGFLMPAQELDMRAVQLRACARRSTAGGRRCRTSRRRWNRRGSSPPRSRAAAPRGW